MLDDNTSWMTVVTTTDRPKSVRNRYVIEVFVGVFLLSLDSFYFMMVLGVYHRTQSDLFSVNQEADTLF